MPVSVVCRRCGRPGRIPDGIDLRKKRLRCRGCGAQLEPPPADAYRSFVEAGPPKVEAAGPSPASQDAPKPVLSLDDAEVLTLDDEPAPNPAAPHKHQPPPPRLPPPFRFRARIESDTGKQLAGKLYAVLTPHGLFIEAEPNRPLFFAPVGTKAIADGPVVRLTLPGRLVVVRAGGVGNPEQLAADTAAFLAGRRPVPVPVDYRRPWWLLAVGAVLAAAPAAGPVAFGEFGGVSLGVAAALAAAALTANAGIGLFTRYAVAGKVILMTGVSVALLLAFVFGTIAYLTHLRHNPPPAVGGPEPPPPPPAPPPEPPPSEPPPRGPPTHLDVARRDGMSRLDDGPADVTALAVSPSDSAAVVVGYADGTTQVWPLDQPTFESPRPGPRVNAPVRRIGFDSSGETVFLTTDRGLAAARLNAPRAAVLIPGSPVAVHPDPSRERFAAVRNGRVQIRYVPTDLVKNPPPARIANGLVVTNPKDETLPLGVQISLAPPGPPTFLAWHPAGRLLCGTANGSIVTWPGSSPQTSVVSRDHKAAVKAWAVGPEWPDFATGDDQGFVGYWPAKAAAPTLFSVGKAPVRQLAFSLCGGELAVADAAGWLSVWDPVAKTVLYQVRRPAPVAAVAFGPHDDILLIADGKGVEVWWLPEFEAQAIKR